MLVFVLVDETFGGDGDDEGDDGNPEEYGKSDELNVELLHLEFEPGKLVVEGKHEGEKPGAELVDADVADLAVDCKGVDDAAEDDEDVNAALLESVKGAELEDVNVVGLGGEHKGVADVAGEEEDVNAALLEFS